MSDTPNEIWCDTGLYYDYKTDWSEGSWLNNDKCGGVKYVRADRIEELEAKLAKAVDTLMFYGGVMPNAFLPIQDGGEKARTTLAELKGEK